MATITEMANATKPSPSVNSPATHQRPATNQRDIPAARRVTVGERATELSDEVLESLEAGQRAAIEAAGAVPGHRRGGGATGSAGHVRGGEEDHRVRSGDGRPAGAHAVRLRAQGHQQRWQVAERPQRSKSKRRQVSHRPPNSRRIGAHWCSAPAGLWAGVWLAGRLHALATETSAKKPAS
jgi:hypothetical protein